MILELLILLGGAYIWYSSPDADKKAQRAAIITGIVGMIILGLDFTL